MPIKAASVYWYYEQWEIISLKQNAKPKTICVPRQYLIFLLYIFRYFLLTLDQAVKKKTLKKYGKTYETNQIDF